MQGFISDRTTIAGQHGDCFIVTGSIGPAFEPRLFAKKSDADAYAKDILRAGRDVWPKYHPTIERRYAESMRLKLEASYEKAV